jgi:hypothetical protein
VNGLCLLLCAPPTQECGGVCVDTSSDPVNCGGCGVVCQPGQSCVNGLCQLVCAPPTQDCGGLCVDTSSDPLNCGGCGVQCGSYEVCLGGSCTLVGYQTIVLEAVDRGWWRSDGHHDDANNNTYTGKHGANEFNSYFTFDLSGISSTVVAAELKLEVENYFGTDAFETLSVWDVSTPAATLDTWSVLQVQIYDDLMTGNQYGTFTAQPADVGSVKVIPLAPQAVADVTASLGGDFSVGVHVDTIMGFVAQGVRFSSMNEPRIHQLVLIVQ